MHKNICISESCSPLCVLWTQVAGAWHPVVLSTTRGAPCSGATARLQFHLPFHANNQPLAPGASFWNQDRFQFLLAFPQEDFQCGSRAALWRSPLPEGQESFLRKTTFKKQRANKPSMEGYRVNNCLLGTSHTVLKFSEIKGSFRAAIYFYGQTWFSSAIINWLMQATSLLPNFTIIIAQNDELILLMTGGENGKGEKEPLLNPYYYFMLEK